jgi:hypothetical protein
METIVFPQEYYGLTTDLIRHISDNFLDLNTLGRFAVVNKICNEVSKSSIKKVASNTINNVIYNYKCRKEFLKFPIITSLDQPFYEIAPVFWVLLSAKGTNSTEVGTILQKEIEIISGYSILHCFSRRLIYANEFIRRMLFSNRRQTIRSFIEDHNSQIMNNAEELILRNLNSNEFFAHLFNIGDYLRIIYHFV